MKTLTSFLAFLAIVLLVTKPLAAAEAEAVEAVVAKFTGAPTVSIPGQPDSVKIEANLKLPAGAVITTGPGEEVHVQPFSGSIATIKQNTTVSIEEISQTKSGNAVTKQTTRLNLRSGNVVSTIDPAKKALTDYSVRTPKGVAAARGTSYSVSVDGETATVASTADTVTFTLSSGASYSIQAGLVVVTAPNGEPQPPVALASVAANDPVIAELLREAVATLSEVVENNLGGLSAESTMNLASQLVAVASAALPAQAATFTSQLVTAVTAAGASTGGNAQATATAVAAVTAAAAQAAPAQAAAIAASAVAAAPQHAGIATAAATQAVPAASAAIIQAVAQQTGQTTTQVQSAADQSAPQAAVAVSIANNAIVNVVIPTPVTTETGGQNQGQTTDPEDIDPSTVSTST